MPVLTRRRFEEMNLLRVGAVALVIAVVATAIALNSGYLYRQLTSGTYSALFSEAAGLKTGDEVRLAGVVVGKVDSVELAGTAVDVGFTVFDGSTLGESTGASIKTATVLGAKFLEVRPSGPGRLDDGAQIPLDRTSAPYDVQELLDTLTRKTEDLDVPRVAESLNTVADTFADTPPELRSALEGLGRLSQTISSRDAELRELLSHTASVSGILAERSSSVTTLVSDGNLLLEELRARREVIRSLLLNVTGAVQEVEGLARDNQQQLRPMLDELEKTLDLLRANDRNLAAAITGLDTYAGSLGEAISSGPWFFALVPNLVPTNLAQQNLPSVLDQLTPVSPAVGPAPGTPQGGGN